MSSFNCSHLPTTKRVWSKIRWIHNRTKINFGPEFVFRYQGLKVKTIEPKLVNPIRVILFLFLQALDIFH